MGLPITDHSKYVLVLKKTEKPNKARMETELRKEINQVRRLLTILVIYPHVFLDILLSCH